MSRETILGAVRAATGRTPAEEESARKAVTSRITRHDRNLVPERASRDGAARLKTFLEMAAFHAISVSRVASMDAVPKAVMDWQRGHNLSARAALDPDPEISGLDWSGMETRTGPAQVTDEASVTGCVAAIAETATVVCVSSEVNSTTLRFLPEHHTIVVKESQVAASYEEAWSVLRARYGERTFPRTVNLITGPSRTADIEQTIYMGAHGPKRLHIVLVEGA